MFLLIIISSQRIHWMSAFLSFSPACSMQFCPIEESMLLKQEPNVHILQSYFTSHSLTKTQKLFNNFRSSVHVSFYSKLTLMARKGSHFPCQEIPLLVPEKLCLELTSEVIQEKPILPQFLLIYDTTPWRKPKYIQTQIAQHYETPFSTHMGTVCQIQYTTFCKMPKGIRYVVYETVHCQNLGPCNLQRHYIKALLTYAYNFISCLLVCMFLQIIYNPSPFCMSRNTYDITCYKTNNLPES